MPASTNWYPISAMRRANVKVRVRWGFVEPFEACLMETPTGFRWATFRNGEVEWLPPRQQKIWADNPDGEMKDVSDGWLARRGWGPEPEAWQPIGDRRWPDPLPEPLPTVAQQRATRFVSETAEFDAAQAAAEMEADRESARRVPRRQKRERPGWLDPSTVKYQPIGHVSRDMAEARIMRAICVAMSGGDLGRLGVSTSRYVAEMAAIKQSANWSESEVDDLRSGRFPTLRQDLDDFLEAMSWFRSIAEVHDRPNTRTLAQVVVVARACSWWRAWADIGREYDVTGQYASRVYEAAIGRIWAAANDERLRQPRRRSATM